MLAQTANVDRIYLALSASYGVGSVVIAYLHRVDIVVYGRTFIASIPESLPISRQTDTLVLGNWQLQTLREVHNA